MNTLFGFAAGVTVLTSIFGASTVTAPLKPIQHDTLTIWLSKLAQHENCPPQGIIDSNNLRSSGIFCYQDSTFIQFVKKYKLMPQAEDKEILNMIGDISFQEKLTRMVFEDNPANWVHWYNSVTYGGFGKPPQSY